jgi:2-polyprenyl-3-methyl-5-hydroxy-6-metoxy-1,4-benzoquinol methylase
LRNAWILEEELSSQEQARFRALLDYDKKEIDARNTKAPDHLNYMNRLETIISLVHKYEPGGLIGDFGCAQANVGLILAEEGYKVIAVDIDQTMLDYSERKHEHGDITWQQANILEADFPERSFDGVVLGELLEHCAYPEQVLRKVLSMLKPDGHLILTTPNGSMPFRREPPFSKFEDPETRKRLVEKQFGPGPEHHLFCLRKKDIQDIMPERYGIAECGYVATVLFNKYTSKAVKLMPKPSLRRLLRWSNQGFAKSRLSLHFYVVIEHL